MTLQQDLQVLKDARSLLSDRERWCQGGYEMKTTTFTLEERPRFLVLKEIVPVVKEHSAYCLAGALSFVQCGESLNFGTFSSSAMERIWRSLEAAGYASIPVFNDSHSHAEVLAFLDAEIEKLEIDIEVDRYEASLPDPKIDIHVHEWIEESEVSQPVLV